MTDQGGKLEDAFEVFKRKVEAIVKKQNRKIKDQENTIETLNKKIKTQEVKLQMQIFFGTELELHMEDVIETLNKKLQTQEDTIVKLQRQFSDETVLVRKNVGNPNDFFDKTWREYKEGFSANGEC